MAAPLGSWLAQFISQTAIWCVYFTAVVYLAYRLFRPIQEKPCCTENFRLALFLAFPISVLSSFLGVGPGFLWKTQNLMRLQPSEIQGEDKLRSPENRAS